MSRDSADTDIQTTLARLEARENTLKNLESVSKLGSWEVDVKSGLSTWSARSFEIFGLDEESTQPSLELFLSLVIPSDIPKVNKALENILNSGEVTSLNCSVMRPDKQIRHIFISGQVVYDKEDQADKILGSTQDITTIVNIQNESKELSELIKYSSNEIYIISQKELKYLYANEGASKETGYSIDELLQMSVYDINPDIDKKEVQKLKKQLIGGDKVLMRNIHKRKNATLYPVQSVIHSMRFRGEDAYVIFDTDITQQVDHESKLLQQTQELSYQANHDTLTQLPNRTLFKDRLSQSIISSKRNQTNFAVLFIDLDQFKQINDSLGHHIGDEVLIEAASRLKLSVREEDTLARLGGDEFTVILKNIKSAENVSTIAQKIVLSMQKAMDIKGHKLFISSSIGVSLYPQHASSANDLLKFADTAMYKAKDLGRNNFQFYSPEMTSIAFERVVLDSSLRVAIKEDQFVVYFQPQIDIHSNKIVGMEALVRWEHPNIGLMPPGRFIPIAEENGLIIEIDFIVMKKAMEQFSQWYKEGLNPGRLALNLSMKQLNAKDFIAKLLYTMNTLKFKPSWLELEVTESQIMDNPTLAIEKLKQISDIGIEIAIDDFGTGYSSLSYLKKLPLDKLKIDQSFVQDIHIDADDAAITKAIIALGNSLNMKLIAEGVETSEQRDFLIDNGCQYIQGYFYAKPMPADKVKVLLKEAQIG